jgi:RES domain-containing protein
VHHFQGTVWRHVPAGAHPLHVGRILHAFGRWNRPGIFGCLYTALTIEGARAEYDKHFGVTGSTPDARTRRDLVSLLVDVGPVLDVTNEDVCTRLQITRAALCADTEEAIELCRSIATWARDQGHRAILAPSAAMDGAQNLMIYVDGPAHQLHIDVGPNRIPLLP